MKSRLLVAAAGLPVMLAILCLLPPFATTILFSLICVIGVFELFRAVGLRERRAAMALCMLSACGVQAWVLLRGYGGAAVILLPFTVLLFGIWVSYHERDLAFGMSGLGAALFSGFLVPLGLAAMTALRKLPDGQLWVLAPLVATFLGDTGAYFVGRGLGKRKMAPRTSPKKTMAGLYGGLLFSAGFMVVYGLVLRAFGVYGSLWKLGLTGLIGGMVAQLGDLSFSVIKRQFGVKDYGKLLPGHGGAYDRFDSTTFAAPAVLALLTLLGVIA